MLINDRGFGSNLSLMLLSIYPVKGYAQVTKTSDR